jgi:hypothetical protein
VSVPPIKIAVACALSLGLTLAACNKSSQSAAESSPPPQSASDAAAVSSAEAAAAQPSAGTMANAKGENTKSGPPSVNVSEEIQSRGGEADPALRTKVEAAQKAGRAPTDADVKKAQ